MNELIYTTLAKAKEDGINLTGWTYKAVAALVILQTGTEHTLKDLAEEIASMTITGEISFA